MKDGGVNTVELVWSYLTSLSGTRPREKAQAPMTCNPTTTMSTTSNPPERITKVTIYYPLFRIPF
jgi:hypothetical protein